MRSRANIKSHPVHPMLVAFPIGLWVGGFLMDLIGLAAGNSSVWIAGWYAQLGGCIGAALAAIFGAMDLFGVVPPRSSARKRGYTHAVLNVCALGLFIAVLAVRGGPAAQPTGTSILLGLFGVLGVAYSGWLGGTLVYRNQIGVDHRYANAGKWKEREISGWDQPACNEGELAYGQMMLLTVGKQRVVIGKCADGIVAFADHCTHRGGPLSDGALVGCTVQCPWHGSQFDAHTGRVVAGPAGSKVIVYDVQIRNREVYVSPKIEPEVQAA
ncbi:MAG TPA: DUF2231 domain-containing protein [Terriglobales bacterium]|nr:DUF2231 domain-containing protein [Terriglobales bacterium]